MSRKTATAKVCLTALAVLAIIGLAASSAEAATMTFSSTAPTVDGADIAWLGTQNASDKWWPDPATTYGNPGKTVGQTFTTGSEGAWFNAITFQVNSATQPTKTYTIRVGTVSGTTFAPIASESATQDFATGAAGDYFTWTLDAPVFLSPNTVYGVDVGLNSSTSAWQTGIPYVYYNNNSASYSGGTRFRTGTAGYGVGNSTVELTTGDRVFHADLSAPTPAYWDLNGTADGAGGPGGIWNAANTYWNTDSTGGSGGTMNAWTLGQTAVFAAGADASGTYSVTVEGTPDIGGLSFEEGTVTLTGGTALRLVANSAVNVAWGVTATVQTPITEDVAGRQLVKYGPGTLVLSGPGSYTGPTNVVDGTLQLGASNILPDASNVAVSGAAVLDLAGNSDTIAGLDLGGAASVTTGVGTLTLGGNASYDGSGAGATISGKLDLGGATRTFTVGDSASAADDLTVSADISGTGAGLTKAGAGTLVLSGTNSYDGNTTLSAGALRVTATAALPGYDSPGRVVFDGGTFLYVAGGGLTTGDADAILTNATKTSGNLGIDTTNGDLTQWTALSAATNMGGLGLTKLGSNALVLDRANDYTGPTAVAAGTLRLTDPNAIGFSSALTLANGTTLELRSDTDATFTTPGNGTTSFATVAHPGSTVTVDVDNNGSGSGNSLTLSGGVGINATSAGTSTVNVTSGNGYVLRTPVALRRTNNQTSTLVLNPTTASVIVTQLTHGMVSGGGLYLTLGGTSIGNEVTSPPDTYWLYITKSNTSTWTWSADVPAAQALGSVVVSGGNLIVTGTLRAQGADTRSVQVNTGGTLHYNSPGAVDTSNRTDVYLVINNGSLDNTSGAAITTSTYNPRQYWKGNVTFIGSGGADSDLDLGTGAVTMNGTRTVTVQNADATLTVGGVISATNVAYGLIKDGPGKLALTGMNTYSGDTLVNAGTLSISNAYLNDTAAVKIATDALMDLTFTGGDIVGSVWLGGALMGNGKHNYQTDPLSFTPGSTAGWLWVGPLGGNYWAPEVGGGSGTWSASSTNWAANPGEQGTVSQAAVGALIFTDTAGTVSVDDTVTVSEGMRFSTTGYSVVNGNGAPLITLAGPSAEANTITTDPGMTATINVELTGNNGLTKAGAGTLVLGSPNNSYSGGTTVKGGVLQVATAGALPAGKSLTINAGGTVVLASGLSAASAASAGGAAAVPEPGTIVLLAVGVTALQIAAWRRRRGNSRFLISD